MPFGAHRSAPGRASKSQTRTAGSPPPSIAGATFRVNGASSISYRSPVAACPCESEIRCFISGMMWALASTRPPRYKTASSAYKYP